MKLFHALMLAGLLIFFFGLGFASRMYDPTNVRLNVKLPAGANMVSWWKIDIFMTGSVSGNFTMTSAGTLNVSVMSQSEYDSLMSGGARAFISNVEGVSGSFSVALPGGGTYFIVFLHGSGSEPYDLTASVRLSVSTVQIGTLVVGLVLAAAGVACAVLGWRIRADIRKDELPSPGPDGGVTYFETQEPPQEPPPS